MLKLLFWIVKWLAKSTRTLDLFGCKKMVVDKETSPKAILWGQNVVFTVALIIIVFSTYLIVKNHPILGGGLLAVGYLSFIALWKTGDKITTTIDETLKRLNKTLEAEPTKVIATYKFTHICNIVVFSVQCKDVLNEKTDYNIANFSYNETITQNSFDCIVNWDGYTDQISIDCGSLQKLIESSPQLKEFYDISFGFICDQSTCGMILESYKVAEFIINFTIENGVAFGTVLDILKENGINLSKETEKEKKEQEENMWILEY